MPADPARNFRITISSVEPPDLQALAVCELLAFSGLDATERPSHMIDPFPKAEVIWSRACCRAKSFLDMLSSFESLPSDLDPLLPSWVKRN